MADTKLTALTETTAPATTDDVYIVTTPGGTPASKRCTIANLKTAMGLGQGARVYNSGNISINDNTLTALTFNSERYDTDTIHDPGTNPSRLTCKTAGKYVITGHVQWDNVSAGGRLMAIKLNNTSFIAIVSQLPNAFGADYTTYMSVTTVYDLALNDYVELLVQHTRGSALNVIASAAFSPEFGMQRIG